MKTLIAVLAVVTLFASPTFAARSHVRHLKEWHASTSFQGYADFQGYAETGGDVWFPKAARTCTYPYPWCMREP
jgi:hypothetical protein